MSDAKTPQELADQVAKIFFGVTDEASRRRVIRECLMPLSSERPVVFFCVEPKAVRSGPMNKS
jgi:hypothetical protein